MARKSPEHAALMKLAHELQVAEWERQRDEGAETVDHVKADQRVLERLRSEDPQFATVALNLVVGRARGSARIVAGPEIRQSRSGQLSLLKRPDTLLKLDEEESAYLGVLVEKRDGARLNRSIGAYDSEARDALDAASRATAKTAGLREILDDILSDREVTWDDDEDEGSAGVAVAA